MGAEQLGEPGVVARARDRVRVLRLRLLRQRLNQSVDPIRGVHQAADAAHAGSALARLLGWRVAEAGDAIVAGLFDEDAVRLDRVQPTRDTLELQTVQPEHSLRVRPLQHVALLRVEPQHEHADQLRRLRRAAAAAACAR